MKAALLRAPDEAAAYGDFAEPVVSAGHDLVTLVAAGIHPSVRSLAAGRHYGATRRWPIIPGVDAVARTADGRLVFTGYLEAPYGTLAERMAAPSTMQLPLPAGASPVAIAGGLNPGLASWMPLSARAKTRARPSGAGASPTPSPTATPTGVKKSLIHDVDGVIQITPVAISHALNVTGPIFVRPFRGSRVSGSSMASP